MASGRLNLQERYRIHALLEANFSARSIAIMLDRNASTISREMRRNRKGKHYQPDAANDMAQRQRAGWAGGAPP
ncbi:helix-turn-helix domain-containing protein [Thermomonas sp.]|uniref:helix-turn-helix domain-containing protein n=1 Tax=Thermomonas sp. TaxID=1971895 RepID=UPI0035B1714F